MLNKTIHVTHDKVNSNWRVKQPSNERSSAVCNTKQ